MTFKRAGTALALVLFAVGCDSGAAADPTSSTGGPAVEMGKAFPTERCDANKAAGTITYLSSFDFAAAASIVEVLVAKQKGYFDELCLDVDVRASFSLDNYPLIAANQAQFSSGGSFSEVVTFATENSDADLVAMSVAGKTAIEGLVIKDGLATTLDDLRGTTIGVKGKLPTSVQAMLTQADLIEGTDFETVPLDGFDPLAHIAIDSIVGFPVYKSNEPGQLDRAGIPYTMFDPTAEGIPGSFGVLYTNRAFLTEHPTAAQDFMRAAMQGLADAIADPDGASMIALDFIDNNGNPNFLSPDSEKFRWQTESKLVADSTPEGQPVGLPDSDVLQAEVDTYAEIGLFDGKAPDITDFYDADVLAALYDESNVVIWPLK